MMLKAQIEMTEGTKYKYEFKNNSLVLDRVLNQSVPVNYGFVPGTECEDGDPLDVFVLSSEPIVPNTTVPITLIGVFKCVDNGEQDDKLFAIVENDFLPVNKEVIKYSIRNYLETYKKGFKVQSFENIDAAEKIYLESKV